MGIPIEKAQPFIEAMALAGVEGTKLQAAMGKLATSVGTALEQPLGKAAFAFKQLGISQAELEGGDTEQILKDTAKALDGYADSATKTALERTLLGKQGPQIVAALQGEAEMEAKIVQIQTEYGTKLNDIDAKSAKYFGETLKLGMSMFEGVATTVTRNLLPGLQVLVNEFIESGRAGGVLHDVLGFISTNVTSLGKDVIELLAEPLITLGGVIKDAEIAWTALGKVFDDVKSGKFKAAKDAFVEMNTAMDAADKQTAKSIQTLEDTLDGLTPFTSLLSQNIKIAGKALKELDPDAVKVADTLKKLSAEFAAQAAIQVAASAGLNEYRKAQDEVAVSALRLQMIKEKAKDADIDAAVELLKAKDASKQFTDDQVAGLTKVSSLTEQFNALLSKNTELEKAQAEIAAHPGMIQATQDALLAEAKLVDEKKQGLEVDKEIQAMDQSVTKSIDEQKAAMTLSTNALKLHNEQLKLQQQYEKDIAGKGPEAIRALAAEYNKADQQLVKNNADLQTYTQSFQAFGDGAKKGFQDAADAAKNFNQLGLQDATAFTNDLTTAFMNMGSGGKKAFEQLLVSMLQMIEQQAIHFAITQVELAILRNYGITGQAAATLLGAAGGPAAATASNVVSQTSAHAMGSVFSGGSVTPFSAGGLINGPTLTPMALMGESGPEAVMPLSRNSAGKLGVSMSGDTAGGSTTIHHHATYVINSTKDAKDVAKETKRQVATQAKFIKGSIATQQRPGGLLNRSNMAFAR
jgi:lambda family phage tail tape measure protein